MAAALVALSALVTSCDVAAPQERDRGGRVSESEPSGSIAVKRVLLSEIATPEELSLWARVACAMCHGENARGIPNGGPDLTKIIPLYVAKFPTHEEARAALSAYLEDPAGSPKLREDAEVFRLAMPPMAWQEDAPALAEMLLRLAK